MRGERYPCPCCDGLPVILVGAYRSQIFPRGVPAERLCGRHLTRWAHIRALEAEVLDGEPGVPESLADSSFVTVIQR